MERQLHQGVNQLIIILFFQPIGGGGAVEGWTNRKTAEPGSESADLARVLLCYGGQQPLLWGNRQITNILHLLFSLGSSLFFKKTKLFWGKDKLQFSSSKQIKSNCFLLCSKSNKTSLKVERERYVKFEDAWPQLGTPSVSRFRGKKTPR